MLTKPKLRNTIRIVLYGLLQDRHAVVLCTIIDEDILYILVCLLKETPCTLFNEPLDTIYRYYYRYLSHPFIRLH